MRPPLFPFQFIVLESAVPRSMEYEPSLWWCESYLPSDWKYVCESRWAFLVGSVVTALLTYRSLRFLQWYVELLVGTIVRSVAVRIGTKMAKITWAIIKWTLGLIWMMTEVCFAVAVVVVIGTLVYKYVWEGISPRELVREDSWWFWWWSHYYLIIESWFQPRESDWGYRYFFGTGDRDSLESYSSSSSHFDGMWGWWWEWTERNYLSYRPSRPSQSANS